MAEQDDDYWDDDMCPPDEEELVIVCPDDMCRGQFDGEGPPCGRWQDSCVRYRKPMTVCDHRSIDPSEEK